MQLVAYGAQDFYLTGNPQITFFKVVYRRHTNFATESIEQTFNGSTNFNGKAVCNLQRSGDLVTKMYLRTTLNGPDLSNTDGKCKWAWVTKVGHALMTEITLEIGGTQIDKHYNDWLNIWYELARNFAQDRGYDVMIGNTKELTTLASSHNSATLWVPLQFACCRNDGLALPVIALQYHDIKITISFNRFDQLINKTANYTPSQNDFTMSSTSLFVDYVYLDNEERKRFAQASHEYLFEQLQFTGAEGIQSTNAKFRINANHPCKEIIWVAKNTTFTSGNTFLAYNPNNHEASIIEATKRFVLRCAKYNHNTLSDSTITYSDDLPQGLKDVFNSINPVTLNTSPTLENITIMGNPLTLLQYSTPISLLFSSWNPSIPIVSDGHPAYDVSVFQPDNYGIYLDGSGNPTNMALLQLNSHDRFSKREGTYFNYVQPWQCHTNTPSDGIDVFSFALNPEEHQPSGTCNFSRIDNANLNIDFDPSYNTSNGNASILIFLTNYNVLRIMSGMGGLAYSN